MRVVLVAPSRKTWGGISSVIEVLWNSRLHQKFNFEHLVTQLDIGCFAKLSTFALACLKAPWVFGRADLIHVHAAAYMSFRRKLFFVFCCILLKKPYVIQIHFGDFPKYFSGSSRLEKRLIRFALQHAAKVWMLSRRFIPEMVKVCGIPESLFEVIQNPGRFPVSGTLPDKKEKIILFAGWLCEQKGVFDLICGFAAANLSDWHLIFAGKMNPEPLRKEADRCGVAEQVQILSWQNAEALKALYARAAIVALPSYSEGLPMTLIEAASAGCAILATSVGAIPDVIPENRRNLLFEPGNVPALTDRLRLLVSNEELRRQYGNELLELHRQYFSQEVVLQKIADAYRRLEK